MVNTHRATTRQLIGGAFGGDLPLPFEEPGFVSVPATLGLFT